MWAYLQEDLRDLALELKRGSNNRQWLRMRFLYRWERVRKARLASLKYRSFSPDFQDSVAKLPTPSRSKVQKIVGELETTGLYLGYCLPIEAVEQIRKFAEQETCYGNRSLQQPLIDQPKAGIYTGYYFNTQQCEAIASLSDNQEILAIASAFLGGKAKLLGTALWWSFRAGQDRVTPYRRRAGQWYHYDLDGIKTLKFFFYLTDVEDDCCGPHRCVVGSASGKLLPLQVRRRGWSGNALQRYYSRDRFITITGLAGFGFIEDPFCFHGGAPPTAKDRLILSLSYGLVDYGVQHDRLICPRS